MIQMFKMVNVHFLCVYKPCSITTNSADGISFFFYPGIMVFGITLF